MTLISAYGREVKAGLLRLLVSENGEKWKEHAVMSDDELPEFTEESDLYLCPDGQMWCVARTGHNKDHGAYMFWSDPPYTSWQASEDLGYWIHAPAICEVGDNVYVAGRHDLGRSDRTSTVGLFHLTRGKATLLRAFEPSQDSSYPGLVSPEPGKLVMSFYTNGPDWQGKRIPKYLPEYARKHSDADIFLAEFGVDY